MCSSCAGTGQVRLRRGCQGQRPAVAAAKVATDGAGTTMKAASRAMHKAWKEEVPVRAYAVRGMLQVRNLATKG